MYHIHNLLATCFQFRVELKTRCFGVPFFTTVVAHNVTALSALHLTQNHRRRPLIAAVSILGNTRAARRGTCNMPTCLLVLGAERVAIPDQSLVSTLSQQHRISEGSRSVHHDLLPSHGL